MSESDVAIYEFESAEIRMVRDEAGEPWFVVKDVCDALNVERVGNLTRYLAEDERATHQMSTPGGMQEMAITNESGLYQLIIRSEKPEADRFRRWITHDVLPSIRKTGRYALHPTTELELAKQLAATSAELVVALEAKGKLEKDLGPQGDDYATLSQIFDDLGLRLTGGQLAQLGRQISARCRAEGVPVGRALLPTEEYNRRPATHLYPIDLVLQYLSENVGLLEEGGDDDDA